MPEHTYSSFYVKGQDPRAPAPTADTPFMHVWRDCVWAARGIGPTAKLILLRIGCFVDQHGRGCSMSYRQLAADCDIDEKTARRIVAKVGDVWLDIKSRQGRLVPGKGHENLYHVMTPPSVLDIVQERKAAEAQSDRASCPVGPGFDRAQCPTYTVEVEDHLSSDTPSPNSRAPRAGATSNSNVIDFTSLKWGGRS